MPFGYPKRAFNSFPLRDHSNLMVIDGVGKWSGHILVYRFSWRFEHIKYLPFRTSYKKKKQEVIFSCTWTLSIPLKSETLRLLQSLLLPAGYTLICNSFKVGASNEGAIPFPEIPCSYEAKDGSVGAGMTETQDTSHPLFSQNPKQGLVASGFWHDWAGVTHYQYQPLSYEHS